MASIAVAFRFHVNFYHSYRGDSLDERGIGKDIRIIRSIIATLDALNADGIPVHGTWDAENLFSLERMIPESAPDILEALVRRSSSGADEIEIMSYNNGLLPAHTRSELDAAVRRSITNSAGSGVADLFPAHRAIMRPQEMMWTPPFVEIMPSLGVEAVSLYYSRIPFNTYGGFIVPPDLAQRFNALRLRARADGESIPMIPAVNQGDLADYLTLRRMLRILRRRQINECPDRDLLVLVDMDADDEFWVGMPVVRRLLSTGAGLGTIVRSVADLPYVSFTTPGSYLDAHPPVGDLVLEMDTADGAFDGYASWAEKHENSEVYALLDRARRVSWASDVGADALDERVRALSTTHFGLAAPVMNVTRLADARSVARAALDVAAARLAAGAPSATLTLDLGSGDRRRIGFFRLARCAQDADAGIVRALAGRELATADGPARLLLVPIGAGVRSDSQIGATPNEAREPLATTVVPARWENGSEPAARSVQRWDADGVAPGLELGALVLVADGRAEGEGGMFDFSGEGQITGIRLRSVALAGAPLLASGLTYGGRDYYASSWRSSQYGDAVFRVVEQHSQVRVTRGRFIADFSRRAIQVAGLAGVVLETLVVIPELRDRSPAAQTARLERGYDPRLTQIMPSEIVPGLAVPRGGRFTVWRQSYLGSPIAYTVPYPEAKNERLDSSNNAVAQSWIAVSDGRCGVLVAQGPIGARSFAFCPLRVVRHRGGYSVRLNPFGSYRGSQLRYPHADTGLGRFVALATADHLKPLAPSYAGRRHHTVLFVAPFEGNEPPRELVEAAWAFSHPPEVLDLRE